MPEQLACEVLPLRRLWNSVTAWGVSLSWWAAMLPEDVRPIPDPAEFAMRSGG